MIYVTFLVKNRSDLHVTNTKYEPTSTHYRKKIVSRVPNTLGLCRFALDLYISRVKLPVYRTRLTGDRLTRYKPGAVLKKLGLYINRVFARGTRFNKVT